jgi:cyclopropane fatty-acyl-phospholipid synthase-like methyltransferase
MPPLNKTMTVLDVGCGDGRLSSSFVNAVKEVIGLDVHEEALKKAEDKKIGWELTVQVARSRLDEAQKNLVDSTGELDYMQSKYDDLIAKIRTF